MARPHGKFAFVDPNNPVTFAMCDRCGKWRNQPDLVWQVEWAGQHVYDIQVLVCKDTCYDIPNEQLRTIVLPPDPPPVLDARPPNFQYEEYGPVQSTLTGNVLQGATILPVQSVDGFVAFTYVWVQLNNANYAEMLVNGVNGLNNTLTLSQPLPFSAPFQGSVTVSSTEPSPGVEVFAVLSGNTTLSDSVTLSLMVSAMMQGSGN